MIIVSGIRTSISCYSCGGEDFNEELKITMPVITNILILCVKCRKQLAEKIQTH